MAVAAAKGIALYWRWPEPVPGGPQSGVTWFPERVAFEPVVLAAVLELLPDPLTDGDSPVGGVHRKIAFIEKAVQIAPEQKSVRDFVALRQGIRHDVRRLQHRQSKLSAAAVLGRTGGSAIALRGSDCFRQLAAKRKTRAGGRPRKES
jgi:hypothetical protein